MGYDLHVTRTADWTDAADHPITAEEWIAAAEASPHLEEHPDVGGGAIPAFRLVADPDGPALYWDDLGQIQVRGVGDRSFPHLVDVATDLEAVVVGDDGEHYRADGTTFEPGGDAEPSPPVRLSAWRVLLRRI